LGTDASDSLMYVWAGFRLSGHFSVIPVSHFGSALEWYLVRHGVFLISVLPLGGTSWWLQVCK